MKLIQNKKFSILAIVSKYSFVLVFAFVLLLPYIAGPVVNAADSKTVTGINFNLKNPIKVNTIPEFIEMLLNVVLVIGVPIVALAIIYCGFLFVKARGNGEEIKSAKGALMYTIVGAFLLLGAWVLATAIKGTVDEIINTQQ
jgi:hypothetical protein